MPNEELQPFRKLGDYLIWIKEKLMDSTTKQIIEYKKTCEIYGFEQGIDLAQKILDTIEELDNEENLPPEIDQDNIPPPHTEEDEP